jgi:AhpD family alkylhydroperoxidase
MEQRANIEQNFPEAYKAMYSLAGAVNKTVLTPIQKQLIKIRASQLNSCAFCIDMHTKEAMNVGESIERIFLLSAWRETNDVFTREEKALLAMTEEVTLIHQHGVSDATYDRVSEFFSNEAIAQIIMAIIVINGWNRIAVSTHLQISR